MRKSGSTPTTPKPAVYRGLRKFLKVVSRISIKGIADPDFQLMLMEHSQFVDVSRIGSRSYMMDPPS